MNQHTHPLSLACTSDDKKWKRDEENGTGELFQEKEMCEIVYTGEG